MPPRKIRLVFMGSYEAYHRWLKERKLRADQVLHAHSVDVVRGHDLSIAELVRHDSFVREESRIIASLREHGLKL
jgi:hypothetical protein